MLIGAGRFQLPAIEAAHARGLRVLACDGDPAAAGIGRADEAEVFDIRDSQACVDVAAKHRVDAVMSVVTEPGVVGTAEVAAALDLPGMPVEAAAAATDKARMRELFAAAGLPSPAFRVCRTIDDARRALLALGLPVVVKPSRGSGSRGVSYLGRADDLGLAVARAAAVAGNRPFLVEAFMPGAEVAVEALVQNGAFFTLCVNDKRRTPPPFLLDVQLDYPSPRPADEVAAVVALAEAGARALGIDNAPVHVEIMMTPEGPHLVEMAARGAGFHVFTKIVPWVAGIDTMGAQLDLALGNPVRAGKRGPRGAVLDFPPFPPGLVTGVSGFDEVRAHEDVLFCELLTSVGERIAPLTSGADRPVALATRGATLEKAQERLRWAHERMAIATEPDSDYARTADQSDV